MLVKVGEVWVSPDRVTSIDSLPNSGARIIADRHILWPGGLTSDACAEIINGSLQSFGGEVDEAKEPVA